jgi:hypothetical protein
MQTLTYSKKWLLKLIFNLSGINDSLLNFCMIKHLLDPLFNINCQVLFHKIWDFSSKYSMTITHSKEMSATIFT